MFANNLVTKREQNKMFFLPFFRRQWVRYQQRRLHQQHSPGRAQQAASRLRPGQDQEEVRAGHLAHYSRAAAGIGTIQQPHQQNGQVHDSPKKKSPSFLFPSLEQPGGGGCWNKEQGAYTIMLQYHYVDIVCVQILDKSNKWCRYNPIFWIECQLTVAHFNWWLRKFALK